jgi:mono/diheme cytochrome c family protein
MSSNARLLMSCALLAMCAALTTWVVTTDLQAQEKSKDSGGADMIERGAYLVNKVARCGDCHTPRDAKGQLDESKHLQGDQIWFASKFKFKKWENKVPDITASGLATSWPEEKLIKLLTSGKQTADMPMPAYDMKVEDAKAIVSYLKSLPGKKG